DNTPPTAPTGLSAQSQSQHNGVYLSWNASSDSAGVYAYYIYRNGAIVGGVPGNILTFRDTSYAGHQVVPGQTFTYTVKAMDINRNLSAPSAAISFSVPFDAVEVFNGGFEDHLGDWILNWSTPNAPPAVQSTLVYSGTNAAQIPQGASIQQ